MDDSAVERLADLVVSFGANVQPGQIVLVGSQPGKEALTRAVTTAAYRRGARYVEITYDDLHARRARIQHGGDDSIGFAPSWQVDRLRAVGEQRCAVISLTGNVEPHLLDGLDPDRLGRDTPLTRPEWLRLVGERLVNWSMVPCPTPSWAQLVHPGLGEQEALRRLWEQVATVCRLDEADPVASWEARMDHLVAVSERMNAAHLDGVHFRGPGTDLTVGLLPGSRWLAARLETVEGVVHRPNIPSEEVFTAPDPERVEGTVRSTKPLELDGTIIDGLRVRFEGGRAVGIDADSGAEVLRARTSLDAGAARIGEVALVDGEGRMGPLDTVFFDTLIDENAASHLALVNAYAWSVSGDDAQQRINRSRIHIDFMIGGEDIDVTGITSSGDRVPLLLRGAWQL